MGNKSLSSEYPLVDAIINKIANSYGTPLTDDQIEQLEVMDRELMNNYVNIPGGIEKLSKTYIEKDIGIITPMILSLRNRKYDEDMDKQWQYIIHFKYFQFHRGLFNIQPILTLWMNETKLRLEIEFPTKDAILLYASDRLRGGRLHIDFQERFLPIKF